MLTAMNGHLVNTLHQAYLPAILAQAVAIRSHRAHAASLVTDLLACHGFSQWIMGGLSGFGYLPIRRPDHAGL